MEDLMRGIRMLASLTDSSGDDGLLNAAKDLSGAFNSLLFSLNPSDRKVSLVYNVTIKKTHQKTIHFQKDLCTPGSI